MSDTIRQYLAKKGYDTASDETYSHIAEWLEWYQGDVVKFHKYKIYNGINVTSHRRYTLGMAKKICEDWANLILNEKVAIKAGRFAKRLNEILEQNNFKVKGNQLIELAYALGTGAFVEYKDENDQIVIDYIRADMIYPLSWDNGVIKECAFGSSEVVGGKEQVYLQIHRHGYEDEGENPELYYIENHYIDAESGKELIASEDVDTVIPTAYKKPLFQIIMPNICNNIDLDSPLGVSVYANSIDQLKGCDLVYDSYMNEYVLGRKRIMVPVSRAQQMIQKDGTVAPAFDPSDTVYISMPGDRQSDQQLTEIDMKIRASEHELGIQRCLDVLSLKTGMGTGRYQFDSSGVKTATEVISDKSDLYQNRQKNAIVVREAIIALVKAISFLDKGKEMDASVDFDDSIIEDSNTTIDKNIKLVNAGLRSKVTAIMEIDKCTEAEAQAELERIAGDNQITGQDIDWTEGDDDESKQKTGGAEADDDRKKKEADDSEGTDKANQMDKE